jgi:hypothetical protein
MFIAVVPYETAFSTQWLLCLLPVPVTDKKLEINYIGLVFFNELNRYLIS